MAVLETNYKTMLEYIGRKLSETELEDTLLNMGFEAEFLEDDTLRIDITPERIDLISPQGCARAIRQYLEIEKGLKQYPLKDSGIEILIEDSVKKVRPYTAAAVVRGLKFTDENIKEIIAVQEKLHQSYGRNRKHAAIGVYPLEKIKAPIQYYAEKPENIKFRPLESDKEMTGKQILEEHPTGQAYKHLLEGYKEYPIFVDAQGQVLSMPPIINSHELGKVTEKTKDVFIECSGHDLNKLKKALNIIVTTLADMGGKIETVTVKAYGKQYTTPDLTPKVWTLDNKQFKNWIGIETDSAKLKQLLEKMGHNADIMSKEEVEVESPAYRTDLWHTVDLIDDAARAYGFDNIPGETPSLSTVGELTEHTKTKDTITEIMTGLGFQQALTLAVTSANDQYSKMNIKPEEHVDLGASQDKSIDMLRTWLLPELMKALQNNRSKPFPQKIFEVEDVIKPDSKEDVKARNELHLSAVISDSKTNYTSMKSILEALSKSTGHTIELHEKEHVSFIPGRWAAVKVNGK